MVKIDKLNLAVVITITKTMQMTLCGAVRNCNLEQVTNLLRNPNVVLSDRDALGKSPFDICQQAIKCNQYYLEIGHPSAQHYLTRYQIIMDELHKKNNMCLEY